MVRLRSLWWSKTFCWKPLLLLLNARGRHPPPAFAAADNDAMHLGKVTKALIPIFLNLHTMVLHGATTAEGYGKLPDWDSHPDAFDWMHTRKQFLPGEVPQTHLLLLQPAGSRVSQGWPPYPPQPAFNPWLASHYPPQIPVPGEPSVWFEGLVTAVSKRIKENEQKATADDIDKNAAPANLSIENKNALVDALRKQKEGKLTMEQVFRELSQVCICTFVLEYELRGH